jgi:hypothetical protein
VVRRFREGTSAINGPRLSARLLQLAAQHFQFCERFDIEGHAHAAILSNQ